MQRIDAWHPIRMASNPMIRPAQLAQHQARLGSVKAFSTPRRVKQRCTRGPSLMVSASKRVLVPVANGSEEIEAVTSSLTVHRCSSIVRHAKGNDTNTQSVQVVIIDVLRRAGAEVTVASVEDTLQVFETSHSLQSCSECRESWHPTEHVSTVRQVLKEMVCAGGHVKARQACCRQVYPGCCTGDL